MSLNSYKQKREFSKTPEPKGKIKNSNEKLIFVVQEHHASHLHWDFRLEINGVLKSWAIPKEPPTAKGIKRLAIQVEDHPLEYANFEGKIPEGNYGAGIVKIWDKGNYELINAEGDPFGKENSKTPRAYPETFFKKMFTNGKIEVILDGKKLKGKFALIKTSYGKTDEQKKKSWLIMKI